MDATIIAPYNKEIPPMRTLRPTVIWVDYIKKIYQRKYDKYVRILVLLEPLGLLFNMNIIAKHYNRFHFILSYYFPSPKTLFMQPVLGTTWVHYSNIPKNFQISFLCGDKTWMPGHNLRHKIWDLQDQITIPKTFYVSGHSTQIRRTSKNPLIDSNISAKQIVFDGFMFHLCIESDRLDNYITEKIVDCFITKTCPVYWGCPNLGEYFNPKGVIVLPLNETEIVSTLNSLTPEDYFSRLPYMEENYQKALRYIADPPSLVNVLKKSRLIL